MKEILRNMVLFIFLMKPLYAESDVIAVDRIFMSNAVMKSFFDTLPSGESVDNVSLQDHILIYAASLRVINPTKKTYYIELVCVDEDGNLFLKKSSKMSFSSSSIKTGNDVIKEGILFLKLEPSIDTMVKGQIMPFKMRRDYFIKLFIDKKLIGITGFTFLDIYRTS